ncbi:MAG: hypothetical protein HFE25_03920 [Clostridia bacterium]|jgi:hypothetical protein|nr:hypothetical protein [Clostridia bacterium]
MDTIFTIRRRYFLQFNQVMRGLISDILYAIFQKLLRLSFLSTYQSIPQLHIDTPHATAADIFLTA